MGFDNGPLIKARKNVEKYEQVCAEIERVEKRMKELAEMQPLLEGKLRKEATERNTVAKKASGIGPVAWVNRKKLPKEIMESDEAEAAYVQAGTEYEKLLGKREELAGSRTRLEDAPREYRNMLERMLGEARNLPNAFGTRMRNLSTEMTKAQEDERLYVKLIEDGSNVIRECSIANDKLDIMIQTASNGIIGFIVTQTRQYGRGLGKTCADMTKLLNRYVTEASKLNADWFHPEVLAEQLEIIFGEIERAQTPGTVIPHEQALEGIRVIRNSMQNIGTLMLAITNRLRTDVTNISTRNRALQDEAEQALLTYREQE